MTSTCTYPVDRDDMLIAYLYDEIDASSRTAFEAHVSACAVCRAELDSLRGVRQQLARWDPPKPNFSVEPIADRPQAQVTQLRPIETPRKNETVKKKKDAWLPDVPAWAQVAAAMLILGVAAGIANFDVRYDQNGLVIRTGWSKSAPAEPVRAADATRNDGVTREELVALEQRLRGEVRAIQAEAHAVPASDKQPVRAATEGDVMRRVQAMLDENDKRQQRELALRVGEVLRDVNAQRQADLVRIDHSLGAMENNLGVEVLKQRERVNYLMRVNQRQ